MGRIKVMPDMLWSCIGEERRGFRERKGDALVWHILLK